MTILTPEAVHGEEILSGHMQRRQKVGNVERDERVALSVEGQGLNERGLREYLVVHGRARVQEGGAAGFCSAWTLLHPA